MEREKVEAWRRSGKWIPFFFAAFCSGIRNIQAFTVHWFTTVRQERKWAESQSLFMFANNEACRHSFQTYCQTCWAPPGCKRFQTQRAFTQGYVLLLTAHSKKYSFLPPPCIPLSMLCHVDSPPGWYRRAAVCDTEDLHGLPLWSPLAMTVQHGRVHPFLWRICVKEKNIDSAC